MRCISLLFAFTWIAITADTSKGGDYSKIGRTVKKSPVFETKTPLYARLVFGRSAKLAIWVVLDGKQVYLDRNGDGDLTGKDEKFKNAAACSNIELADPDGKTRYVIEEMTVHTDVARASKATLSVNVDIKGPLEYQQYGGSELTKDPTNAPIVHFHGPLSIQLVNPGGKLPTGLFFQPGAKAVDLQAVVGTVNFEHGYGVMVRSHRGEVSAFPKGVVPVIDVEFPAKLPNEKAIKKRYLLDQFC